VLRCFDDDNITHVDGSINPLRDKETIDFELIIKDLETIDSRINKVAKQAKTGGDKQAQKALTILENYKSVLESGKAARVVELDPANRSLVSDLFLLTDKPVLYVCNVDDASVVNGIKYVDMVRPVIEEEKAGILLISAATEADIADLESYEEKQMFLEDLGLDDPGKQTYPSAYEILNLQTYFTTGPDESRAWTFTKGIKAPQAAGIIHSDFERGFIRAEVIKYDDYVRLGSEAACRDAGKIGIEGKDYVVQDGDIMHFSLTCNTPTH
jgi:GTP-binding protein YchF